LNGILQRIRDVIEEGHSWYYWRYTFPNLPYVKKHFDRTDHPYGVTFLRKKSAFCELSDKEEKT